MCRIDSITASSIQHSTISNQTFCSSLLPRKFTSHQFWLSAECRLLTSNPLLRHHHRSDNRHQQQQRGDLEGEHVWAVQHGRYLLCVVVFYYRQYVVRKDTCPLCIDGDK